MKCFRKKIYLNTFSCCLTSPLRFRGILWSILARIIVLLPEIKQTCAKPSCIMTAATSAV